MSHTLHAEKPFTFFVTLADEQHNGAPTLTILNKIHREISATIVSLKKDKTLEAVDCPLCEIIFFENGKKVTTHEVNSFASAFKCLRGIGQYDVSSVFDDERHFHKYYEGTGGIVLERLFDFFNIATEYYADVTV